MNSTLTSEKSAENIIEGEISNNSNEDKKNKIKRKRYTKEEDKFILEGVLKYKKG
jgi:hypothetical protein